MTDHPSNPPSQTKGQEIARRYMFAPSIRVAIARDIDAAQFAALAAQQARHKAAEKLCLAIIDAQAAVILRLRAQFEEAESKLREERDRCLGIVHSYGVGYPLGDIAAAIRSGQAQQADDPNGTVCAYCHEAACHGPGVL